MDTEQLTQLVIEKLDQQGVFYTRAEVIRGGLNPAQRLLTLAHPEFLTTRVTVTVSPDQPFLDLRTLTDPSGAVIGNRLRHVRRVVLGDVTADTPQTTPATGEVGFLRPVSLTRLAATRIDWMAHQGEVRYYWQWGPYWLGLYKRPIAATTITIIARTAPRLLTEETPTQLPDIAATYHALVSDIAVGLTLIKEGEPHGARGFARLQAALGLVTTHTPPTHPQGVA